MKNKRFLCKIGIHFWKKYTDGKYFFRYCKKCLTNESYQYHLLKITTECPMTIEKKREISLNKLIN